MSILKQLGDGNAPVALPVGGDFTPTGLIGPVGAALRWSFGSYAELPNGAPPHIKKTFERTGWTKFYFDNEDDAKTAKTLLPPTGKAVVMEHVWRITMDAHQVLNSRSADFAEKWDGIVAQDVTVGTLASWTRRHPFHQIAFPCFVQAMALAEGWEGVTVAQVIDGETVQRPIFHVDELLESSRVFTEAFQREYIGLTQRGTDYQESITWKRRTALWAALGEDDPTKVNAIGAGTEFDTTSERLSSIMGTVRYDPWQTLIWVRLMLAPDPLVTATYTSGGEVKRNTIGCIVEVFANQEAAQAAADAEMPEHEEVTAADIPGFETSGDTPSLPEAWAAYPDDWKTELRKVKAEAGGNMPPAPKRKEICETLDCTASDLVAWWDHV